MRKIAIGCCALTLTVLATPAFAQRKKPVRKAPPPSAAPAAPPAAAAPAPAPAAPPPAAAPAPEPTPEPALVPEPGPAKPEEAASGSKRKSEHESRLLDVGVAFDFFTRHLSYGGDTRNVFPPYDMNGGPAAEISAGVYPYRTDKWSIGITGAFQYAFALNTNFKVPSSGQTGKYSTKSSQFSIGPRGRYLFGQTGYVGLGVEYGSQSYSIDLPPPTATDASVPDVSYSYLRPNLEARVDIIPRLAVLGNLGYLAVLNAGEILSDTYFIKSRSSVFAFDFNLGATYEVAPHFEIRPGFDIRRYHFKFSPLATDPRIATSADDVYLGFSLGVSYWM
jgi:hypothetical protein